MAQYIPLTQRYKTLVDDDIVIWLYQWSWHIKIELTSMYAVRCERKKCIQKTIRMHNEVLNFHGIIIPKGYECDHHDQDSLNNQFHNLKIVTRSQNNLKKKLQFNNTSGVKGVHFHKQYGKWEAYITINYKKIALGFYDDFNDACEIRWQTEIKYNIANSLNPYFEEQ